MSATADRPFEVMLKPNGPRCNIDCRYCYYLDKEQYYPDTKRFAMSDTVLEAFVQQHIEAQLEAGQREVVFAWQGGEPTLAGRSFYRRALALQRAYTPPDVRVLNTIQTNGLLLDVDWCRFLRENDFLVGLSLDGPRELHDRYRLDSRGRGTFAAVMASLKLLKRHAVRFNVICVVHRHNAGRARDVYRFFRKHRIEHLQFIPLIERSSDGRTLSPAPGTIPIHQEPTVLPYSVTPRQYGTFLCELFDMWIERDVGRCFIQFFEAQIGVWSGHTSSMCWFSEECGNALAMEHNGDLYSCDQYVYPSHRLGNLLETPLGTLTRSDAQRQFGEDKHRGLPRQCQACDYRFACHGGCPKHRFETTRDGEPGLNYLCEAYLQFFEHAADDLSALASLIAKGLPAELIMRRNRPGDVRHTPAQSTRRR